MNTPLAEILRYNKWANLRLLDACVALSDELLDARLPGLSGSIRVLLVHIVGGQQTFVLRTKGRQHEGELGRESPWPGFDELRRIAAVTSDELIEIASALDEDSDVDLPYMGKRYRFPRSFFIAHAVQHGCEHRTEIRVALKQLTGQAPDLDAWAYASAAGHGAEVTQ